jgi:hypothetical protein
MRTFHWNAPIIGVGALALSVLLPAPLPLKAEESGASNAVDSGRIKPVSAFRDDQGRICRH